MKTCRGLLLAVEAGIKRNARRAPIIGPTVAFIILAALAVVFAPVAAQALTFDEAKLIDKGFKVFNKQTFNGNGRTCATCHLPQRDFDISPADIPSLSAHQKALVRVPG